MISDQQLKSLFDDVSKQVRSTQTQSRTSIVRESQRRFCVNGRDVAALHVMAAASLLDGQPDRGLAWLQRDTASLVDNAQGQRLAGYACLLLQQWQRAMSHFDHAVKLDPCQHDAWARLGGIVESSGDHEKAITYYRRALVFDDKHHESALALSRIYTGRRNLREAIDTLRVSLLRDRRNPRLNLVLAGLLQKRALLLRKLRRWDAEHRALLNAADCYGIVVAAAPTADVCVSLGLLQNQLGRYEKAKEAYAKAVELDPRSAAAISHLASVLVDQGSIDDALKLFRRSMEIDPNRSFTHFRYTRAKRFRADQETMRYARSLESMIESGDHSPRDQVQLRFSLAKVLDDLGDFGQAWENYDEANRLKQLHRGTARRRPPLQNVVGEARRVFTKRFFGERQTWGNSSRVPLFIIGMPRSGTTLTEQILSSHPEVAGAGELKQIERIRQRLIRDHDLECQPACPRVSRQEGVSGQQSRAGDPSERQGPCYPDLLEELDPCSVRHYADRYLRVLQEHGGEANRVTDKMPTNFLHLGLIAVLFPNATVIHCRRHPMDVLVSAYCQNLNPPFCDLTAMVTYHRQYRRLMAHWHSVLPLKIHSVDYESLVTDPEPQVRAMLRHSDLEWHPDCLAFHANRRSVHTPSKWQVRQPMYQTSVDRWRRFEAELRPIADQIEHEIAMESRMAGIGA